LTAENRKIKTRWKEEVGKNARILGIRSWWSADINRGEERQLLREAKTLTELYSRWWW
jgi:hypothetical protein